MYAKNIENTKKFKNILVVFKKRYHIGYVEESERREEKMNLQNVFKHMSQYWEVYEYVRDGVVTLDAVKEHLMKDCKKAESTARAHVSAIQESELLEVYGNKVCLKKESLEEFYESLDELLNLRQFEKGVRGLRETEEELYKVQRRAEADKNHYTHELMELEKKIYILQEEVDKYYQEKEENHRKYTELQKDHKSLEEKVELLNERDEILQKQIHWYKSTNILLKDQVALARICPDVMLITRFHVTRAKKKEEKEVENILCYKFLSPFGKLKYKVRECIKKIKKFIEVAGETICAIVDFFTCPLRYVYTQQLLEGKWDVEIEQRTGGKSLCRLYPIDTLDEYKDSLEHRIDFFQRWILKHSLPYMPEELYIEKAE